MQGILSTSGGIGCMFCRGQEGRSRDASSPNSLELGASDETRLRYTRDKTSCGAIVLVVCELEEIRNVQFIA